MTILPLLSDFERLTAAILDKTATEEEINRFNTLLIDYPELLDVYLEQAQMHALLECRFEENQQNGISTSLVSNHLESKAPNRSALIGYKRISAGLLLKIAAVVTILLSTLFLLSPDKNTKSSEIVKQPEPSAASTPQQEISKPVTEVELVYTRGAEELNIPQTVPGTVSLKKGEARLRMSSGVELALVAPVSFMIPDMTCIHLSEGRIIAYVPPGAVGFTVYAPRLTVCDLGTVFGVASLVNQTDVFVFDGNVKVMDADEKGIGFCQTGEGIRVKDGKWPIKIGRYEGEAEQLLADSGGREAINDGIKACNLMNRIIQGGVDRFNLPVSKSNIYDTQTISTKSLLTEENSVLETSSISSNSTPVVSNVRFSQRVDSRLIDVFYDLAGTASIITLDMLTNGTPLAEEMVSTLSGDVSKLVQPGIDRHIIWQAATDWPEHVSTQMQARVTAWLITQPPPIWVIDLTPGPEASNYATYYYTSEKALPAGGLTNDLYRTDRLVLRRVPAGSILQGSPEGEIGRQDNREQQHMVTLTQPFYIGVFEVTQWQWAQVMGTFPAYFSNPECAQTRPVELVSYNDIRGSAAGSGWPDSNTVDSESFIGRIRSRTGFAGFDLPTEAQWETACRAGMETALNNGFNLENSVADASLSLVGRYSYNGGRLEDGIIPSASSTTENGSAKAGGYLPNALGLYDMHGNVWEWCRDWYIAELGEDAVVDPHGATTGTYRVLRGGSWLDQAWMSRSACRLERLPGYSAKSFGFRLLIEEP